MDKLGSDNYPVECGIDLTLKTVADYSNCGSISANNADRILSTTFDLRWDNVWSKSAGERLILDP
ncbi:MAG: hypothetical protein PHV35_04440, partial [Mariniphaga sp.]|nr:hypothetical protein [Mariniphaga sp.]